MSDPAIWVGAVAALFSAGAAWLAASAARSSNLAAMKMTQIEAARRHQELTPQICVSLRPLNPGDTEYYKLSIEILGPTALQKVAGISVHVRDDRLGRDEESPVSYAGNQATAEQLAAQVWGPLRLTPNNLFGSGQVDQTGRSIEVRDELSLGDSVMLQMEPTRAPPWTGDNMTEAARWWDETVGTLVRFIIEVRPAANGEVMDTEDAWVLPVDLDIDQMDPVSGVSVTR